MRVFLLGATPSFDIAKILTLEARLAATGGNSGNQVIAEGLLSTFQHDSVCWDHSLGPDWVKANCDIVVVAAANFLFKGFDFGGMAGFIERVDLPVVVAGLGAQASRSSEVVELQPGTERFVAVIAERATIVGIRGEFTADVLAKRGIRNVQVIGCPSYYRVGAKAHRVLSTLSPKPKIVVNGSRDVLSHSSDPGLMKQVLNSIVKTAIVHNGVFVAQTELPEMVLASAEPAPKVNSALQAFEEAFSDPMEERIERDTFLRWAKSRIRVFWSVEDWRNAMEGADFCYGTRFHGNIVALQAGVPALVVCHDARTTEMCDFLKIPNASLDEASTMKLADFYDRVLNHDFHTYRARLIPPYHSFLRCNGLIPVVEASPLDVT
jgi:hypothetical protein